MKRNKSAVVAFKISIVFNKTFELKESYKIQFYLSDVVGESTLLIIAI